MAMNPRICICCGEPMAEGVNVLSPNPNVCASCSSMADGMDESGTTECGDSAPCQRMTLEAGPQNEGWPETMVPMPQ
jgi:hypothetical protein